MFYGLGFCVFWTLEISKPLQKTNTVIHTVHLID